MRSLIHLLILSLGSHFGKETLGETPFAAWALGNGILLFVENSNYTIPGGFNSARSSSTS